MSGKRLKSKEQINAERRRAAAARAAREAQGRPRPSGTRPDSPERTPNRRSSDPQRQERPRASTGDRRREAPRSSGDRHREPPRGNGERRREVPRSSGERRREPPRNNDDRRQERPNPNAPRRRRSKKRKKSRALRVLLIVLLVLVILCGSLIAFGNFELSKINRLGASIFTKEDFEQDAEGADTIQAVDWGEAHVATSVEGVVNILLVGQDTRDGTRQRSDSMIILSINQNTNQLTMVSLMRDLYVQIPGYSDNRINAAYAFGGFELLDATIEQNFGIVVDYNVEVNFNGFIDAVDKVGGVDVELTEEEVEYMNSPRFAKTMGYQNSKPFVAGPNHLDGKQALCYARIRRVGDDFARTQRQRTIIQAVYDEAQDESWTKLLGIYESVADDLTTDMSPLQLVSIAFSAYNLGIDSINSYRVPASGTFRNETINSMQVLVPIDWNETRSLIKDYLYGDPTQDADNATTTAAN